MKRVVNFLSHPLFIVLTILTADQWSKFWIKTNMFLGEEFPVLGDWFIIHFTENNGMAFGIEFAGEYGKLFLTLFRIIVVTVIGIYLFRLPKKTTSKGLLITGSLIFAGAVGNIIDSVFYGVIFDESYNQVATFLPESGGYSPLLYGKVVDMLYFPLMDGFFPDWLPIWGGQHFLFFRPVFNIADSAITVGIFSLLIFQRKFFKNL
ncbi:lipoprotein signal peptidase [Acidiluteibacter ferrifornacis]|uniref:Lipoprotein signal peptidase n=1 Tax=Acidiluteibacter ferrifornacis TaxID=2692424 RepID=A0A6N9NGN7_9FLAO|nr:lipoprotein signal peptidase [Acidiluteibacter ferrifornacis]NBG64974.1 lipoprotein signal peptidase [Acidiluteibacter ferrifornacis]